jgi:YesN/AraC family two-component response regulator
MHNITLSSLAKNIHLHPVCLGRLLKNETGKSFSYIILGIRIEKSKELLKNNNIKTYEVAKEVGILDPQYFSQVFKKYTGMTPKKFRNL